MVGFMPFNPVVGISDLFTRRDNPSAVEPAAGKNPLTSFPDPEELVAYPSPASFVVRGVVCDQFQSPLFSKIPPEIRNEIFRLSLTEYVPEGNEWTGRLGEIQNPGYGNARSPGKYVKRPGYEGLKTVDTDLLRTCKRVYDETKLLPLQDLEVCFYMSKKDRAPRPYTMSGYTSVHCYIHPRANWFKPEHWTRIDHYHVFGQMYLLEQGFRGLFRSRLDICLPTTMTLTLRYTDWWNWEMNAPIFPIRDDLFFPLRNIELPSSVQTMIVEFENIETKIKELDAVVNEMFSRRDYWVWKRRDQKRLKVLGQGAESDGVKTWRWTGPTTFGHSSQKFPHHGDDDTMGYVVKVVTWDIVEDE